MSKRYTYLGRIRQALGTAFGGLRLTASHYRKGHQRPVPLGIQDPEYFKQDGGSVTIQYPAVQVPVPETGRYRLHMETDDCIGCDKCPRICPVDCITIETFRADGDLGRTSDGTIKRLHLPVFDIDMGKCMFCGLCTTVCPTECLTMTKVYDFSEYDRDNLVYHFGAYSPEEESRVRQETEAALARKKAEKTVTSAPAESPATQTEAPAESTPGLRPRPMIKRKPAEATAPEPTADAPAQETPHTPEAPPAEPSADTPKPFRPRPLMRKPTEAPAPDAPETPPSTEAPIDPPADAPPAPKPFRPRPIMRKPTEAPAPDAPEDTPSTEVVADAPIDPPADAPPAPKPFRPRPIMRKPTTPGEDPPANAPEP